MQQNFLVIAALFAVASAQKPAYSENKVIHDRQTILLGGLFPFSENINGTCHHVRLSAVAGMEAMVFAIRQINKDPTLLPRINLTYDIRDTCSIPNVALEQSLSYVQNPPSKQTNTLAVSGIVGAGLFSLVSKAVASLFRLFQIPQISYGSTATVLSDRNQYDYFFRTVPADSILAHAMADTINYFKWSYIIALHSDDTYGTSGLNVILENIQKGRNTTCIAIKISVPIGSDSEASFDNVVAQMNQPWVRNASVAFMFGYKRQTNGIMAAIERLLKREPDTPLQYLTWVGCDALLVDSKYNYLLHGMIRMDVSVKGSPEFQEYFTSLTESNATVSALFREYLELANNCGFNESTCYFASHTDYTQGNEISSIIDAVYAFAHAIHGLIQNHCNNSELCDKILVSRSAGMAVNGTLIRDYLLNNLSFPGLSSDTVTFDSSGNDGSFYSVKNLQEKSHETYDAITVGTWTSDELLKITGKVEWNTKQATVPQSFCSEPCRSGYYRELVHSQSECCWTCHECPGDNTYSSGVSCSKCKLGYSPDANRSDCIKNEVTFLTRSNPWAIVILICSCVGICVTIFMLVIYAIFRNDTIIKSSSLELSVILLIGLLLCYINPFFFVTRPSSVTCGIRRFSVGFSFAVCFSALLVKTNRLYRIFNRSLGQLKISPRFISPVSQVVISLTLLSIQVVMATLWLAIQHPKIMYTYKSRVTEVKCNESSDVGLVVSLGYNLLLLILSTYFAFLARNIPENYNEAKFINITLYTIIIIWLAFIPTYFATASLNSVYQTSSLIIAIVLSATTTHVCLFGPKFYLLFNQKLKEKKDAKAVTTINGTMADSVITKA